MPFLQGETLESRLRREPVQPAGVVLKVAREVAEGLVAAGRCTDEARFELAQCLYLFSVTDRPSADGLAMARRALGIINKLAEQDPSATRYMEELGGLQFALGYILSDLGTAVGSVAASPVSRRRSQSFGGSTQRAASSTAGS